MANPEEAKLEFFLQWLQVNGVELRGCNIKYCDSSKGFGIFSSDGASDGVLLVVPLHLAITPMRVLQDPVLGPECRAMFEQGEVDDRFLMVLFLTFERLRKNSSWKPYLDMLPTSFGTPLWFTNDELLELRGTTLSKATELQKKKLRSLFEDKVKSLVTKLLITVGDSESKVCFEDFLWANSIFWTRALSIPLPRSYVFPQIQEVHDNISSSSNGPSTNSISNPELVDGYNNKRHEVNGVESQADGLASTSMEGETICVEGLVPGIDFCNHDLRPAATWEVDGTGATTGVPCSMYLLSVGEAYHESGKEISISYGNKGNEELLYLYGFVLDSNPDDYIMIHYPTEVIESVPFSESKAQLLEAQIRTVYDLYSMYISIHFFEKAEMRCLLSRSLLDRGFFPSCSLKESDDKCTGRIDISNYSWSGQRKTPSYVNKLVFPEEFLSFLRTIAMRENELYQVSSLLEELLNSGEERQPSDTEVRAAIWEACGDSGALQLLVDLLNMRMMDLEECSGTEESDTELLDQDYCGQSQEGCIRNIETDILAPRKAVMGRNKWSSVVYRRGQKQLTRLFLKEAEHALQLAMSEGN